MKKSRTMDRRAIRQKIRQKKSLLFVMELSKEKEAKLAPQKTYNATEKKTLGDQNTHLSDTDNITNGCMRAGVNIGMAT
jgi:hypothetical protein